MKSGASRVICLSVMACAVAEGLSIHSAHAQTHPQRSATVLEEIVVSARRRQETVQNVPAAISTIGRDELRDLRIGNFGDIAQTAPNLEAQRQFGSASSPFFIMRGVTTGTLSFQADSGIALYIDNVYIGRPAGTAFDIADVERVEVLRGPQGTLFGRNSIGGAINFVTAAPTGRFGVVAEATMGNHGLRSVKGTFNFDEVGGVSSRLTVMRSEQDGYVRNHAKGTRTQFSAPFGTIRAADDFGNEETTAVGLALRYTGIDRVSMDYRFDYTDKDSSQLAPQMIGTYDGTDAFLDSLGATHIGPSRRGSLPLDLMSQAELEVFGHSLTIEWEVNDWLSLKSISSYREFEEKGFGNDIDGGALTADGLGMPGVPFSYISSVQARDQDQWSQELQLVGTHDNFDWILGGFWFSEEGEDNNPVFIGVPFEPGSTYTPGISNGSLFGVPDYFAGTHSAMQNRSRAVYAHLSWYATADLEISGGLRYTRDRRQELVIERAAISNQRFSSKGSNLDGVLSATYTLAPGIQVYGKYSTGYLSGGTLGGVSFDKETIETWEMGLKSDWLQNRLRLNVTAFQSDRDDLQTLTFSPASGTVLINSGDSRQRGIEIEASALPMPGLMLTANYGYLKDDQDTDLRSFAPKHTLYGAVEYDIASFGAMGHLGLRFDARWVDDRYGLLCPAGSSTTPMGCANLAGADRNLDRQSLLKSRWDLGLRMTLADIQLGQRTLGRVSLWGRNLLDNDELEFVRDLENGTVIGTFQPPRSYGVDLSLEF